MAEADSVASFQEQLVKEGVPQGARQMGLATRNHQGIYSTVQSFFVAGVVGSLKVPLIHL